jgi:uncharacterized protein (TIGR02145 family)
MKKIINLSKRTYWFKGTVALFTSLLFLVLISCEKNGSDQEILLSAAKTVTKPPKDVKNKQDVTDIDGNVYKTVKIGNQVWMVGDLKTTMYNDGTSIPNGTEWLNLTTPAYCWYNNDISNKGVYGALYNWYAVDAASNGGKNICPTGWHVPTIDEWYTLLLTLDADAQWPDGGAPESLIGGGKLKETGYTHWLPSPNGDGGATNETGFTAVPGGVRMYTTGESKQIGMYSYWWSSSEGPTTGAYGPYVEFYGPRVGNYYRWPKEFGFSVRCLKD